MRGSGSVSAHLGVVAHEGDAVARITRARAAVARVNTHPGRVGARGRPEPPATPVRPKVSLGGAFAADIRICEDK